MDTTEELIARKCIATLLEMPEEWKPRSEIPETAEAQLYHKILIACGYCETEQQCAVRLLNGSDVTVRFISHGTPATMDGAGRAVHPDVEKLKLLNAHLPDDVDTNALHTSRILRVRPTIVGQLLREEFSGNSDEAAVVQFVAMSQGPPPYSAEGFHIVPQEFTEEDPAAGGDTASSLSWDADRRELSYCRKVVRSFSPQTGNNVLAILNTFTEDGWPERVDIPVPDRVKAWDAIRTINRGLIGVKFYIDGDQIGWEDTE
jgi:hypothetical protein